MKVLLTGASSYVGARLFLDLRKTVEVVETFHSHSLFEQFIQLDTTHKREVERVVEENSPDVIIHAAANASGSWCEAHPKEAKAINQLATEYVVNAANKNGAKFILISSFATAMDTLYGRTKAESEKIAQNTQAGYVILRPSLIIGYSPNTTNDRPFNRFLKNLVEKTEASYDTSWHFQPTYIRHMSEIIEAIFKRDLWGNTIPVAVPDVKTRYELARDILEPFLIPVKPVNKHDKTEETKDDLRLLYSLRLPIYTYEQIITEIIGEIKQREKFVVE